MSDAYDLLDRRLLGSSVHGISQARILEWAAISFSRGFFHNQDQSCASCISRQMLCHWPTTETPWFNRIQNSLRQRLANFYCKDSSQTDWVQVPTPVLVAARWSSCLISLCSFLICPSRTMTMLFLSLLFWGAKRQEEYPKQRIRGLSVDCKLSEDRNLLCKLLCL